jgi:Ca-activated chloride channel family protein
MKIHDPIVLFLLPAAAVLLYLSIRHRGENRTGAVRFSSVAPVFSIKPSLRQRLFRLPLYLRITAAVLLIIALARPQSGRDPIKKVSEGVAIEMVVDRSGSMRTKMDFRGEQKSRFEVVKEVFEEFITGDDKGLGGRENDMIGVVAFARYSDTVSPLTLSHDTVLDLLEDLDIVSQVSADGTAIGEAVSLAAARLKTAEEEIERSEDREKYRVKSKAIILLTDGENNAGERTPEQAMELAREWGIKIYTIGIGNKPSDGTYGSYANRTSRFVILEEMANRTGGIFRPAHDEMSLRAVYEEIDDLEKSEFKSLQYLSYRELFLPFAFGALVLLVLEMALSGTLLRRLP